MNVSVGGSVEILSSKLFRDSKLDRSFMVTTGYFDESGTHADSPIVTVAGFIASAEQWAAYERELTALNLEYGVKVFHAKDLRGRKGDFKNWLTRRRATYNSRFLKLADDHLGCGLATLVRTLDYRNIYRAGEFPRGARPDTTYGLCFRAALAKSILYMKDRRADWPLNVVMEMGNKNLGDAVRVFGEVKEGLLPQYSDALGYISFGSKRDCLPIAAADALAYAIFRMSAGLSKHPTEPNAAVVGPADPPYYVSKIPLSRTLIDEKSLGMMRDDFLAVGQRLRYMPL